MPFRPITMPMRYLGRPRASIALVPHPGKPDPYVSIRITGDLIKSLGWGHCTYLTAAWDEELRQLMLTNASDTNPNGRSLNIRGGGHAGEVRWARIGTWRMIIPEPPLERVAVRVENLTSGSLILNLSDLRKP